MFESRFNRNLLYFYAAFSVVLAMLSLRMWDVTLAWYFHQFAGSQLEIVFDYITELGDAFYWIVYPGVIYGAFHVIERYPDRFIRLNDFLLSRREEWKKLMLLLLSTAVVSGVAVNILKIIFARYRPVELLQNDNFGFTWFDFGYRLASFPSGHSATALSIAMALALVFPRHRYWLLLAGAVVIFSRVILTEHYLSDVIMGGFYGVLSSLWLYMKIYKEQ